MHMLACGPPPPLNSPQYPLLRAQSPSPEKKLLIPNTMTHLMEAGPSDLQAHKGDPLGWVSCPLGHDIFACIASDHNCCQARNSHCDYFITTTLW